MIIYKYLPFKPPTNETIFSLVKGFTYALCFVFFLGHVYFSVNLWLQAPLDSSYTIKEDMPPDLPLITICPNPPFNKHILLEEGLNFSVEAVRNARKYVAEDENEFPGGVDALWHRAMWPLGAVVSEVEVDGVYYSYSDDQIMAHGWNYSLTPLGPCLTLHSKKMSEKRRFNSLTLQLKPTPLEPCRNDELDPWQPYDCESNPNPCNTTCSWQEYISYVNKRSSYLSSNILLHSSDDPPTLANLEAVLPLKDEAGLRDCNIDIWVSSRKTNLIGSSSSPCIRDSVYSEWKCRQLCGLPCHPRIQQETPQHSAWTKQILKSACHREPLPYTFQHQNLSSEYYSCVKQCHPRCIGTIFNYEYRYKKKSIKCSSIQITIQRKTNFFTTITEFEAYPASKLLSDIGGSLGLFLGASLLSVWANISQIFISGFRALITRKNSKQPSKTATVEHYNNSAHNIRDKIYRTANEQNKKSTSNYRSGILHYSQTLCWLIGLLCFGGFTCVSLLTVILSFVYQPVTTILSLGKEPQPFPPVIVCPDLPFKPRILEEYDIGIPSTDCFSIPREILVDYLIDDLPGFWNNRTTLSSLWKNAAKDVTDIVGSCLYQNSNNECRWKPVLTTNNICFELDTTPFPKTKDAIAVHLEFSHTDITEECNLLCPYYCFGSMAKINWLIIPESKGTPLIVTKDNSFSLSTSKHSRETMDTTFSTMLVHRVKPCLPMPYSRKQCLQTCYLKAAAEEIGCSLPYVNVSGLPACHSQDQYKNSPKYMLASETSLYDTVSDDEICKNKCPDECFSVYYQLEKLSSQTGEADSTVRFSATDYLEIKELYAKSVTGLICEIGGLIGLGLGYCLLDISGYIATYIRNLRPLFSENTLLHMKRCFTLICTLLSIAVTAFLWTERVYAYIWSHPYYTSFSMLPANAPNFPSLTICRWPPFNISSLLAMGLKFDINEHCNYDGRYYRCHSVTSILRTLPGMWNISLDNIWRDSAWDLSDLVIGYNLDAQYVPVSRHNPTTYEGWQAVETEHNRCYTFTPSGKGRLNSYTVLLNTDYKGQKRVKVNDTLTLLLSTLYFENPTHSIVRLHSKNNQVYKFRDSSLKKVSYKKDSTINYHLIGMKEIQTISRLGKICNSSRQYSEALCLAKCQEAQISQQVGCRLPFLPDVKNISLCKDWFKYSSYPRQLGNVRAYYHFIINEKLENVSVDHCNKECIPNCRRSIYNFRMEKSFSESTKVIVSSAQYKRDVIVEHDGYTFLQLMSDIGGVSGFMLGISLLSVLNTFIWLAEKLGRQNTIHSEQ
ncbi:hypothetical protein SK128_025002 [Halocaridina rubra]|uniref:Uncharacterized protein n=1 Tax=Halocaridina rubra TaxID=373956 RepID=A0AAN8ZSK1_HALRR